MDVSVYQNLDSFYWHIFTKDIEYEEDSKPEIIEIPLNKLCFGNLFESHNYVLNPLEKILIYY